MIGEKKAYIISSAILALAASICLIFAVQLVSKDFVTVGGYSMFRVVTGSMEPTISTGSVLICKDTKISQIEEGDIVCYRTKIAEIYGSIVTHRVVSIQEDESGTIYLETKGDANVSSDPYYVESEDLVGKVTWYSGKDNIVNHLLAFLSGQIGFLVCIVFPVLLVSGLIMQSAVKSLKRDLALARQELAEEEAKEPEMDPSELLPGYTTLTYADYEAIYESLRKELLEELNERNLGTDQEQEESGETNRRSIAEEDQDADSGTDRIDTVGDRADLCDDSSVVYECSEDE